MFTAHFYRTIALVSLILGSVAWYARGQYDRYRNESVRNEAVATWVSAQRHREEATIILREALTQKEMLPEPTPKPMGDEAMGL